MCVFGLIPGELLGRLRPGTAIELGPDINCVISHPNWWTPFTSMFMHGGWFHIIGNMWFLWVFGNNVEDAMGQARFVVFYVLCGLAAAGHAGVHESCQRAARWSARRARSAA